MTWPDGFYVQYDYDAAGEMTAVRENGASSGVGVLATYAYDDFGRRGSVVAIADGAGAVTNINKYDEYGAPSIGAPTPIDPAISGASSIRARCG